jgi:hypothetical protein
MGTHSGQGVKLSYVRFHVLVQLENIRVLGESKIKCLLRIA